MERLRVTFQPLMTHHGLVVGRIRLFWAFGTKSAQKAQFSGPSVNNFGHIGRFWLKSCVRLPFWLKFIGAKFQVVVRFRSRAFGKNVWFMG